MCSHNFTEKKLLPVNVLLWCWMQKLHSVWYGNLHCSDHSRSIPSRLPLQRMGSNAGWFIQIKNNSTMHFLSWAWQHISKLVPAMTTCGFANCKSTNSDSGCASVSSQNLGMSNAMFVCQIGLRYSIGVSLSQCQTACQTVCLTRTTARDKDCWNGMWCNNCE